MYSPDGTHLAMLRDKKLLTFDENKDYAAQKKAIKEKLTELLGEMPKQVPLNPVIEETTEHETFVEHRIRFDVEENVQAICLLCIPKVKREKYPLVICLQGHGTGMHISMRRRKYPIDSVEDGDRDMALHALEKGFAALCLDQRGMGERRTDREKNKAGYEGKPLCHVTSMNALLVGRTMIGERCFDISRAIDLALTYPEIDADRILVTGNSGGGTATYYAACLDERIAAAMPSCAVCSFAESIGNMRHCVCNFIPGIAKYMDMGEMAIAIAPRPLIVVNGAKDNGFTDKGVKDVFSTIKKIYTAAGVPEKCANVTGPEGHRYYKAAAWAAFDEIVGWK
jgi:dienelactone hydrolase